MTMKRRIVAARTGWVAARSSAVRSKSSRACLPSSDPKPVQPEPRLTPPFDDLSPLSHQRLAALQRAADDLFKVLDIFGRDGRHPITDLLAGHTYTQWNHYPPNNLWDDITGCAWYYHAHDSSTHPPWEEHGHFHCFFCADKLPRNAKPIALPTKPGRRNRAYTHLVGLCFDTNGVPNRLFTINRWTSNEWMYAADDIVPLIDRFQFHGLNFGLTSRWLSATVHLLYPQIVWALHERDKVLAKHRRKNPNGFSEDQSLHFISTVTFDLDNHLMALKRAVSRRPRHRSSGSHRSRLPQRPV